MILSIITKILTVKKPLVFISVLVSAGISVILKKFIDNFYNDETILNSFSFLFTCLTIFIVFSFSEFLLFRSVNIKNNKKVSNRFYLFLVESFCSLLYLFIPTLMIISHFNSYYALIVLFTPIVFAILHKFEEIGERIKERFGKKPAIFIVFSRIFDIVEDKIFKKLEESDLCNDKTKDI